jgi:AcrR family transcriptional regulator
MVRADALRNREAVVAAAREVFAELGLEAPLEEIARRAGVGIGTLYRRFPTRLDLADAVLASSVESMVAAAEAALAIADPWEGFVFYLEQTGRLQAADRSFNDMMSMRLPRATRAEAAKKRMFELTKSIMARAQASGQLRADVTNEDLAFLAWANTRIMQATQEISPDAWRRHLGLLLDGFRSEGATALPVAPLSPREVYRAMRSLGSRCGGQSDS